MLVALLLVGLILTLVYVYLYSPYDYWQKRGVPGPHTRSLWGDIPSIFHHRHHLIYEFDPIYEKFKSRYNFVGLYVARQPQILVTSAEAAKTVLIKNFKSFRDNFFSDPVTKDTDKLLGRNPFTLKGDDWKEKRAELTPGFAITRVKSSYPLIENVCAKLSGYINRNLDGAINVRDLCSRYTAEVVTSMIYGIDAGCLGTENSVVLEMGRNFISGSDSIWYHLTLMAFFPFITKFYKTTYVNKPVEEFFFKLTKDSLAHRRASNLKKFDYLDYLLDLEVKKNASLSDIAGNGTTFFIDGVDTSGIYMFHTLYELARNPSVQERLRAEINEAGELTYDIVENLTYLEQVLSESSRLHPPIAMMVKLCTEKIDLQLTESQTVTIEPGTVVNVPVHCLHKDNRYYANADKFDPDRFSPDNGGTKQYREECAFVPFGDGPRICVGTFSIFDLRDICRLGLLV